MKKMMWIFIVVLAIALASCSGGGKTETAEPETTSEATTAVEATVEKEADEDKGTESEPEESPTESAEDEEFALDDDGLGQLDSYRYAMTWRTEYDDGTVEEWSMSQAATRDPAARQFVMNGQQGTSEMIQIGDVTWMRVGEGEEWMSISSSDSSTSEFGDVLITDEDLGQDASDYKYMGKEQVNGVQTKHYQSLNEKLWTSILASHNLSDVKSATADFWVANEVGLPKFTVRMVIEVKGKFNDKPGTWSLHQDVTDINQPFTIEAPTDATKGGLPDDIPMYPDAKDVAGMGTMTTFTVEAEAKVVDAFYATELEALGWTADERSEYGTMYTSKYKKGDNEVTLTITGNDTGGCTVIIMLDE